MRIAVPTNSPGGVEAERSDHFGHCDVFTIIDLDEGKNVSQVNLIPNGGHAAGGCMVPVKLLDDAGVEAIVVGGMGARPMRGFSEAGIKVYYANQETIANVGAVVKSFAEDRLPLMHVDQVCAGSGNCHH